MSELRKVTSVNGALSGFVDEVARAALEDKLDKSEFSAVSAGFITEEDLEPYATKEYVDDSAEAIVSLVADVSGTVNDKLATVSGWAEETFQPKGDYLTATALDDIKAASANWNDVSAKLDTADFAEVSGDFALESDLANYQTTAGMADYYNKTEIDTYTAAIDEDLNDLSDDINDTVEWVSGNYVSNNDLTTTLEDYYKTTETSGKNELNTKFEEVQDDIDALENIVSSFGSYKIVEDIEHVTDPSTKVIYLVEDTSVTGSDVYKEYIYISATDSFRLIGDTSISLEDYYTKSQTSAASELTNKFNAIESQISDIAGDYIPTAVSGDFALKTDLADYQPVTAMDDYYTKSETYRKEDIDDALDEKQVAGNYLSANALDEIAVASATWNTVTDKLDAEVFEDISGSFATSAQGIKADSSVQSVTLNGGSELKDEYGNVDIPLATSATDGIMSSDDKDKLDTIPAEVIFTGTLDATPDARTGQLDGSNFPDPTDVYNALEVDKRVVLKIDISNLPINGRPMPDPLTVYFNLYSIATSHSSDIKGYIFIFEWLDRIYMAFLLSNSWQITDELQLKDQIPIADSNTDGLMSSEDKTALDEVVNEISFLSGAIDDKVDTATFNTEIDDIADEFATVDSEISFLSGAIDDIPAQVQSDWTEDDTTDPAYIKNKPNELSLSAGTGIDITETTGKITISVTGAYALSADVDTRLADKLDTAVAATAYYSASNPNNFEENVISAVKIAGTAMTVTDKAVNFDMIPASADSSHPLVTTTDLTAAIADFGGFKTATGTGADLHPDVNDPSTKIVYLVKDSGVTGTDKYKEWICTNTAAPVTWELIGDTSMNLDGYVQFPASYTAGNIVTFGTNSISDGGYTTAQMVNVQPDWEQASTAAYDYIKNKPEQLTLTGGSYIDITSANNQLTIDANIANISGAISGYTNVQPDWNETNSASDAYITNKPDIIVPLTSTSYAAPTNLVVVTAMPPAADIDPTTIYLVKETTVS